MHQASRQNTKTKNASLIFPPTTPSKQRHGDARIKPTTKNTKSANDGINRLRLIAGCASIFLVAKCYLTHLSDQTAWSNSIVASDVNYFFQFVQNGCAGNKVD